MKRTFIMLTAVSALGLPISSAAWAESAQAGANAAASTQVETRQNTGFFGGIGNTVKGWFSSDNDAAGRAEMEANPGYNAGVNTNTNTQADLDATAPAAGDTATQNDRTRTDTSARTGATVGAGVGLNTGTGVAVDADVGGGTSTGMGATGAEARGNIGGSAGNQ